MHKSMRRLGSGLGWLVLGGITLGVFVLGLVASFDWVLSLMDNSSPAKVVMWACVGMAALSGWLCFSCFYDRRRWGVWAFATVFFLVAGLQAFLTGGGA